MSKLKQYQDEFYRIKTNLLDPNNMTQKENMVGLQILQTQLLFEMVSALQIIAQQNKKQDRNISLILKNITGEPIEFINKNDNEEGEDINDTDSRTTD